MKKILLLCVLCALVGKCFAQKETFDLITYTPPKGWQKEVKPNSYTGYTITNKQKKTYCQISIMLSTVSKGSIKEDFDNEWTELIQKPNNKEPQDSGNIVKEIGGWKIKTGRGKFTFDKSQSIAVLTTMSGYSRCASIVATTNSIDYMPAIEQLLASVEIKNLSTDKPKNAPAVQPVLQPSNLPTANGKFAFTTITFDDGWISTVQEDWVEVTKGNIKVLLHYPNAVTGKYYPDSDEGINAAWNNLIPPRYNGLQNYTAWYTASIAPRPYLIAANTTDKQSGKNVYVVLFQKGSTGWIEIISPDKKTFINNFGVDNTILSHDADPKLFASLEKLSVYNKFGIAATDLKGKWSDNYTASFFNYRASDGQYTGTNTVAIITNFNITSATTYKWDGYMTNNAHSAGAAKIFKTTGTFKMINNWQIQFSDIQGKPKTYNAYFSCFKGGRVLWLQNREYGDYLAYGKVE